MQKTNNPVLSERSLYEAIHELEGSKFIFSSSAYFCKLCQNIIQENRAVEFIYFVDNSMPVEAWKLVGTKGSYYSNGTNEA